MFQMITLSVTNNEMALRLGPVQELLQQGQVDVVITVPVFANEAAALLAHKLDASLVQFVTAPFGFPNVNFAVGDSFNPSYMPNPVTGRAFKVMLKLELQTIHQFTQCTIMEKAPALLGPSPGWVKTQPMDL